MSKIINFTQRIIFGIIIASAINFNASAQDNSENSMDVIQQCLIFSALVDQQLKIDKATERMQTEPMIGWFDIIALIQASEYAITSDEYSDRFFEQSEKWQEIADDKERGLLSPFSIKSERCLVLAYRIRKFSNTEDYTKFNFYINTERGLEALLLLEEKIEIVQLIQDLNPVKPSHFAFALMSKSSKDPNFENDQKLFEKALGRWKLSDFEYPLEHLDMDKIHRELWGGE